MVLLQSELFEFTVFIEKKMYSIFTINLLYSSKILPPWNKMYVSIKNRTIWFNCLQWNKINGFYYKMNYLSSLSLLKKKMHGVFTMNLLYDSKILPHWNKMFVSITNRTIWCHCLYWNVMYGVLHNESLV